MNKARITYRFHNQRDRVISLSQDEFKVVEEPVSSTAQASNREVQLNQYTTDFGTWKSPFDAETERLEQLIRGTDPAKADKRFVQQPPSNQPHQGITDEDEWPSAESDVEHRPPNMEHPHIIQLDPLLEESERHRLSDVGSHLYTDDSHRTRVLRPNRPPWIKVFVSAMGAVATGVFIGFFVLSMFTGDPDDGSGGLATTPPNNGLIVNGPSPTDGNNGKLAPVDGTVPTSNQAGAVGTTVSQVTLHLPVRSYSFLQHGIFSTMEGADAVVADLHRKGLAAAVDAGDKFAVFIGMALQREDAQQLRSKLENEQTEIYVKQVDLPEVNQAKWTGTKGDQLAGYLTKGDELIRALSQQTIVQLTGSTSKAPDAAALQTVKTAHQTWTGLASVLAEDASGDIKPWIQKMNTSMNMAVATLDEYRKNPSSAYLWQIQSSMMQYLIAEKNVLTKIAAP